MAKVNKKELVGNIKELNKTKLVKISTKGDAEDLMEEFISAIEEIDDDKKTDQVPEAVLDYYESLIDADDDEDEDADDDSDEDEDEDEDEKPAKKSKKKADKKSKKVKDEDDEEDEDEDEDADEDEDEKPAKKSKKKAKKAKEEDDSDDDSDEDEDEDEDEKPAKKSKKKAKKDEDEDDEDEDEKPKKKRPDAFKKKEPGATVHDAMAIAYGKMKKKKFTKESLIEAAVEQRAKKNQPESRNTFASYTQLTFKIFNELGVLEDLGNGKYKLNI